ncbi:MAG: hypothetical protein KGH75_01860 [Rhodospirillales bacterium]|nr:hypothetical protein [Rhodospirillales bacterium]
MAFSDKMPVAFVSIFEISSSFSMAAISYIGNGSPVDGLPVITNHISFLQNKPFLIKSDAEIWGAEVHFLHMRRNAANNSDNIRLEASALSDHSMALYNFDFSFTNIIYHCGKPPMSGPLHM